VSGEIHVLTILSPGKDPGTDCIGDQVDPHSCSECGGEE